MTRILAVTCVACLLALSKPPALADQTESLPVVFQDDFEKETDRWEPTDPKAWRIQKTDRGRIYNQFNKKSQYKPPHRSPLNIALVKDVSVGDFDLTTKVKSTHEDYGHRDVCLVFGYQDAGHFYYVHLGKKADDHANQIFIVDGKDRTKISTTTTKGTNWDDRWHEVKIVRRVHEGTIAVYFDDMKTPVMTATDTRFKQGRFGIGSFDDTSAWDDVVVRGVKVEKKKND